MRPTSRPIDHHPTLLAAQRAALAAIHEGNPRRVQFLACPQVAHWREIAPPNGWWCWATQSPKDSEAIFDILVKGHALTRSSLSPESLRQGLVAIVVRAKPRALGWVLSRSPWVAKVTQKDWVACVVAAMGSARLRNACLPVLEKWVPRNQVSGNADDLVRQDGLSAALERCLKSGQFCDEHLEWILAQGASASAPLPSGDAPLVALMTGERWTPALWAMVERLRTSGASLGDLGADGRPAHASAMDALKKLPSNAWGEGIRARWAQIVASHLQAQLPSAQPSTRRRM